MSEPEVSVYISATSPQDARDLFEKCMAEVSADRLYPDGKLIKGVEGGGCGQIFTFEARP